MEARKTGRSETRGFVMLQSYYEALEKLPDEQRAEMYDAIMRYVFDDEEPSDLSPVLRGYFILLRPNIDASIKKYAAQRANGSKGGRPRKPNDNPTKTQQ